MLGLDTRGRGRKAFSAAWMCRMAVVLAAAGAVNAHSLHPHSSFCPKRSSTTLTCDASDNETYTLDNFIWEGIGKVIINNAPVLVLKDPACNRTATKEVVVHNSNRVTTESGSTNCTQQIVIHNSKNVRLIDGVDLVRLISSDADEINLPRVSQFDLRDSTVKKVSVRVDRNMSTIEDSTIEVVKAMVINGDFKFKVENSTLVNVESFKYKSTKEATFKDTRLWSVATNGFVLQQGTVKIEDSTIGSLEALSLVVEGGTLVIANSVLRSVAFNSIVVSKNGTVSFQNVNVSTESGIFFTISKGTMDLYPLALLWEFKTSNSNCMVVLYVGIVIVMGLLVGAGITYYRLKRRGIGRTEMDMTELLNRGQPNSSCQSESTSPKPPNSKPPTLANINNNDKNKNTPALPLRPLPAPPQPPQDDGVYEEYSDVQATIGLPPFRPPVPIPDESSCSGGSTLPMRGNHVPMPHNLPNWRDPKGAEMNDDRDGLPPPPPPDEELYDDLAEPPPHMCTKPLPPIPCSKTLVPPQKKAPLPPKRF